MKECLSKIMSGKNSQLSNKQKLIILLWKVVLLILQAQKYPSDICYFNIW